MLINLSTYILPTHTVQDLVVKLILYVVLLEFGVLRRCLISNSNYYQTNVISCNIFVKIKVYKKIEKILCNDYRTNPQKECR